MEDLSAITLEGCYLATVFENDTTRNRVTEVFSCMDGLARVKGNLHKRSAALKAMVGAVGETEKTQKVGEDIARPEGQQADLAKLLTSIEGELEKDKELFDESSALTGKVLRAMRAIMAELGLKTHS